MTTYNQIDVALNRIANAHKQINSYGHGDLWEIASSGTTNYPLMWVVDRPSNISSGAMTYNYTVLIMDLVDKAEFNEKEVLSDTFLMASDILVELGHEDWPWAANVYNANLEPFTERFDDEVAGYAFELSLKVPFSGSSCLTPFDSINRSLSVEHVETYSTEATALFAAMSTQPSLSNKIYIDTLITTLKNSGDWDRLDALWMFAGHDQQASLLNWKSPGTYTATVINSPTFTQYEGFAGNGTTSYVKLNFNPSTNGVNHLRDSASFGFYSRTNEASILGVDTLIYSNGGGRNNILSIDDTSASTLFGINSSTSYGYNSGVLNGLGLISTLRPNSTTVRLYKNGTLEQSETSASVLRPNATFCVGASHDGSTFTATTNRQYSAYYIGSGSVSVSTIYNSIQTYLTSLGKQV